jgi:hypothetical protein
MSVNRHCHAPKDCYPCLVCDRAFTSRQGLGAHQRHGCAGSAAGSAPSPAARGRIARSQPQVALESFKALVGRAQDRLILTWACCRVKHVLTRPAVQHLVEVSLFVLELTLVQALDSVFGASDVASLDYDICEFYGMRSSKKILVDWCPTVCECN